MINWTKVGDRIPTNAGQAYKDSPDTPFIPCLVFACYPGKPQGGVTEICRWDTRKGQWHLGDIASRWTLQSPYVITHFCDNLNKPEFAYQPWT